MSADDFTEQVPAEDSGKNVDGLDVTWDVVEYDSDAEPKNSLLNVDLPDTKPTKAGTGGSSTAGVKWFLNSPMPSATPPELPVMASLVEGNAGSNKLFVTTTTPDQTPLTPVNYVRSVPPLKHVFRLGLLLLFLLGLFLAWWAFFGAAEPQITNSRVETGGVDNDVKVAVNGKVEMPSAERQADAGQNGAPAEGGPSDEAQDPTVRGSSPSEKINDVRAEDPETEQESSGDESSDTSRRDRQRGDSNADSDSTSPDESESTDRGGR
jgi:hypothetical protein